MPRRHSVVDRLVKKIQEPSHPTRPAPDSSPPQTGSESPQEWPPMRFNIRAGFSLYSGLAFLFVSFILLSGILIIQVSSPPSEVWSVNPLTLILASPLVGMFMSGLYFLLNGLSANRSQVLLGKTKMAVDPLFWGKRVIIGYRQLISANRDSTGRGRHVRRTNITIKYHPLNRDKEVDVGQVKTLTISGAEKEEQLLFQLQQRAAASKNVPDITKNQEETSTSLKHLRDTQINKPAKKTRDYWGLFLIIILVGGLLLDIFLSVGSVWSRAQLPKSGVHTMGTVIGHRIHYRKYTDYFFITSEYEAVDSSGEKRRFIQELSGTEEQYQIFPVGSPIPIVYLPQNPKISDISGNETDLLNDKWHYENTKRIFVFMGGPMLTVVVIQLIRGYFLSRKKST